MVKTSNTLQHDVLAELAWDPSVDASRIGVSIDNGVVTLSGHVRNDSEKAAAERIAKRVKGVNAVADEIEVKLATGNERDDADIAKAALDALRWNVVVPAAKCNVVVKPPVNAADVKEKIEAALRRNAEIDARKISVDISDGSVTLRGTVRSFVEREDAVSAAWAAPGVRKVIDELRVRAA